MTDFCPKCGKPITITLPKEKWYYVRHNGELPSKSDSETVDAFLMFLTNNHSKHNIWLCKKCFLEWGKFLAGHRHKWNESWKLWFSGDGTKEVVLFT